MKLREENVERREMLETFSSNFLRDEALIFDFQSCLRVDFNGSNFII